MVSEVQEDKLLISRDAASFLDIPLHTFNDSQGKNTILYLLKNGQRHYSLSALKRYKKEVLDKV
jgi:hypothetical protein